MFIRIFLLVGIVQDKALAALAIEDKKMQYADAEKYLEDVLQSALASSEWLSTIIFKASFFVNLFQDSDFWPH